MRLIKEQEGIISDLIDSYLTLFRLVDPSLQKMSVKISSRLCVSNIGAISANNVLEVDGVSTLRSAVNIGDGYGSSGITLTDAGAISANSNLTIDGNSYFSSQVEIGGGYGDVGDGIPPSCEWK